MLFFGSQSTFVSRYGALHSLCCPYCLQMHFRIKKKSAEQTVTVKSAQYLHTVQSYMKLYLCNAVAGSLAVHGDIGFGGQIVNTSEALEYAESSCSYKIIFS